MNTSTSGFWPLALLALLVCGIFAKTGWMIYRRVNSLQNRHIPISSSQNLYSSLFIHSEVAKFVVDANKYIIDMNDAALNMFQLNHPTPLAKEPLALARLFPELTDNCKQMTIIRRIGAKHKVLKFTRIEVTTQAEAFYSVQDISAKVLLEKTLKAHSSNEARNKHFDQKLALPNRSWFESQLNKLLYNNSVTSLILVIKIENAHFIEQKYGISRLQELTRFVARQWGEIAKHTYFTASIGGACLATCMPDTDPTKREQEIAHLLSLMPKILDADGTTMPFQIRIGATTCNHSKAEAGILLRQALHAVIQSDSPINFYSHLNQQKFIEQQEINMLLAEAISDNELHVMFQPKVDAIGKLTGLEALLRWDSKVLGSVSPGVFIPIAEQSGSIVNLTLWLMNEVCRQIHSWQKEGLEVVPVAINISGVDLEQPGFYKQLVSCVVENQIRPQLLELELTESAIAKNVQEAVKATQYLSEWGFCITLDDFGVGYSGLSKLTTYPVDRVKIDRQFIKNIHKYPKKTKVVEAIVAMCKVFDIDILAEGVESMEEVEHLIELGCPNFQGYVFSHLLSKEDTSALLGCNEYSLNPHLKVNKTPPLGIDSHS